MQPVQTVPTMQPVMVQTGPTVIHQQPKELMVPVKETRRLALLQCFIGMLSIILGIPAASNIGHYYAAYMGHAIWTGCWIGATGLLGLASSRHPTNRCLNGTNMGFNIICCILSFADFVVYAIAVSYFKSSTSSNATLGLVIFAILLADMIAEFVVAMAASIYCCQLGCCDEPPPQITTTPAMMQPVHTQMAYIQTNQGVPGAIPPAYPGGPQGMIPVAYPNGPQGMMPPVYPGGPQGMMLPGYPNGPQGMMPPAYSNRPPVSYPGTQVPMQQQVMTASSVPQPVAGRMPYVQANRGVSTTAPTVTHNQHVSQAATTAPAASHPVTGQVTYIQTNSGVPTAVQNANHNDGSFDYYEIYRANDQEVTTGRPVSHPTGTQIPNAQTNNTVPTTVPTDSENQPAFNYYDIERATDQESDYTPLGPPTGTGIYTSRKP